MGRIWLSVVVALALASPALAGDDDEWGDGCPDPNEPPAAACPAAERCTGKLYLDESYTDCCGRLHIVVSYRAVMQFRQEWPGVKARLNIVNMQGPAAVAPSGGTGGDGPAPAQLTPPGLGVPGLGTMSMLDEGFMDQMRAVRSLNPEEFDAGFFEGWQQGAQTDPQGAALAEQLIPMSEGLSVPEAMDRIEEMLDLYRGMTGGAIEQ